MYGLDKNKRYDVVGIGNAILDVLGMTDDAFLQKHGMQKGTMMLIDEQRASELYDKMAQTQEISGGSAANTLAGMAALGSKAAFIGKVCDDQLGRIYRHDLAAVGVDFNSTPSTTGKPTGCSYILVTPDAERTMNTYLGAGGDIYEEDIDEALLANTRLVYGEGYQWSAPHTKAAMLKAFNIAKANGGKVCFTLSDVFCVEANREEFLQLLDAHFDILFANEEEAKALYPGKSFDEIIGIIQGKADVVILTRGARGSLILSGEQRITISAVPVKDVVDTTGAGDLYAAGFLHGYTHNMSLQQCGDLGSACAAEIIQHIGARSLKPLGELVA